MRGRVIQANFGGGRPRLSALAMPSNGQRSKVVQSKPVTSGIRSLVLSTPALGEIRGGTEMESFPVDPVQLGLARSGGRPLPSAILAKMESAFRQDFSAVRVHEGPQAARIGALAFTIGTDIYFAQGRFEPNTVQGQQMIGHELAHVVQQRQGRVPIPASGFAVVQTPALEIEANRLGQQAAMKPVLCKRDALVSPVNGAMCGLTPSPGSLRSVGMIHGSRVAQPMFRNIWNAIKPAQTVSVRPPQDLVLEEIRAREVFNNNITVVYGAMVSPGDRLAVLNQMKRFMAGTLTVWRGVQQCHPAFPAAPYTVSNAKNPGSLAPPDFANNDNNWIPFYEDRDSCLSVALSWSQSIIGYFNGRGGMDSRRPCALLLQKTLDPAIDRVAFGMAPEVQVYGPTAAVPTFINIDDDWSVVWPNGPHQAGDSFRIKAVAAGVTILPVQVNRVRSNSFTGVTSVNVQAPRPRSGSI